MDICGKDFWVEQQRGREYVRDAGELIALVPGEFSEHGFLRGHNEGDDNAQTRVAATEFVVGQCGRNRRPDARRLNRRGREISRLARNDGGWGFLRPWGVKYSLAEDVW